MQTANVDIVSCHDSMTDGDVILKILLLNILLKYAVVFCFRKSSRIRQDCSRTEQSHARQFIHVMRIQQTA